MTNINKIRMSLQVVVLVLVVVLSLVISWSTETSAAVINKDNQQGANSPEPGQNARFPRQARYNHLFNPRSTDCNCVCGAGNRQMRVVGGNITRPHEFPWLAGLTKGGEFYCGASLITRKHILTAAHCINGFDLRSVTVFLGDHDRGSSKRFANLVVRRLRKARVHQKFDPYTFNNDLAIVELDEPVEFGDKIQPACLPVLESADYSGRLAIVAGWGKTDERGTTSDVLRKVPVPIWRREDCLNSGYGERKLTENMFCAGYPDGQKDACQGDSGGPLHLNNELGTTEIVGIVSWGRGCARPNLPGIYTKVNNYLDWVKDSLNGECLCPPPTLSSRRTI